MTVIHRVIAQTDASFIPTTSIDFSKVKINFQSGTGTMPPALAYKTFTPAYGTVPHMSLSEPGSPSLRTKVGTYRADIIRVRPGSFGWAGTPSLNWRWFAWGV